MRATLSGLFQPLVRVLLVAVIFTTIACNARAQGSDGKEKAREELSAGVIAFVNDNLPAYTAASQLASRKAPPPEVPVPPVVDFPCLACADSVQAAGAAQANTPPSEGTAQVNQWVHDSLEPEATHIRELVKIEKQVTLLGCENGCDDSQLLSPEAIKALKKFGTVAGVQQDVQNLADRVWKGKVKPMYDRYHKDPKRAYAGIQLILTVGREMQLNGDTNNPAAGYMDTWLQTVLDSIEHDAVKGHLYNLCPLYLSILHLMGIMTSEGVFTTASENWSDRVGATLQALDKLMFFDMVVKLHAVGRSSDGGNMDITWMGKAKLHLDIERDHVINGKRILSPCFKPEFLNGGKMRVNVVNFTMNGQTGGVQLVSPHSFDAVLTNPQLNLCDPHPVFQVALGAMKYPQEVIQASGGPPAKATLLASFLGTVSMANELDRKETNALTGNANHLSPDQKASTPSVDAAKQNMAALQAKFQAHKGDMNWMMSPEGVATVNALQSGAAGMVQKSLAAKGFDLPASNNVGEIGMSLASAHLQWTNGQSSPVYQTLKVQKDGIDFELTVSVENTPLP